MHNFCAKIFEYSHYKYCLQEAKTHFNLRVLTNFALEVWTKCLDFIYLKIFSYLQIIYCQHALKAFLLFLSTFPATLL